GAGAGRGCVRRARVAAGDPQRVAGARGIGRGEVYGRRADGGGDRAGPRRRQHPRGRRGAGAQRARANLLRGHEGRSPVTSPGLVERFLRDPNAIWMREMRQSARLARRPWVLFALTLTLGLLMCSIGGLAAASDTTPATIGGALFQVFFSIAYLVVVLVGPAVAANGVASEREGRTWEAVLLTGLRPKDVARGKFMAAYTTIALYIVVLAPVGALSFLFGGVTATEVVVAFVFLFLVAGLTVAFGLAVSSLMSSLRGAIVVTLMLAILIGPVLYFIFGFGASFGIHKLWNEVPEAFPIWLPLAYSRGTLGLEYVLLLLAVPQGAHPRGARARGAHEALLRAGAPEDGNDGRRDRLRVRVAHRVRRHGAHRGVRIELEEVEVHRGGVLLRSLY